MIPKILKNLKFCKIKKGTKKPFEKDWPDKPYTYEEISKWLKEEGGNYGVLCGYENLAVIDADNEALQVAIENLLPKTYRVKTPGGGFHNYFFIKDLDQKLILETENETHLGEVQWKGQQVVGPNSVHPNGGIYEELNHEPIAEISADIIYDSFKPFLKQIRETEENKEWEKKKHSEIDDLNVAQIWGVSGLKKRNNEYYGSHPIHGSETGMNFWINPLKNLWHCFRHGTGGGPLSAIAVKEGIIDCSEAHKGVLRGSKAFQAIEIAREKYGLKKKEELNKIALHEDKLNIIWDKDLENYEEEEKEWLIDKLIPNRSVCILTGKRGTMKTFLALEMVYSLCSGKDFLEYFPTRKGGVLYLDKENGIYIIKKRARMIKNGLDLTEENALEAGYICFSQIKIDKLSDIKKLEEAIQEYHPKVIIIDTYRRAISFDENDAGAVSELFVDILRPLTEKHNLSIILIHHNRKSGQGSGDEMDEIRGSSDLANYADIILKVERQKGFLILKQLKNRNAQEQEPIKISLEFNEEEEYVKMKHAGSLEMQTQEEKCVEILTLWITKNNITQFRTKDAKEIAFKEGIKERNFNYALRDMQNIGLIKNIGFGLYDVIKAE